jgi:heterodisulfide reductase subunit B2
MNNYIFYPGCSLEGSAKAYYDSIKAIKSILGMGLTEIDDWNCCGATEYVGINLIPAYSLIARNLALAASKSDTSKTLIAPCSACYLNLEKADYYMTERPALEMKVNEALAAGSLHYNPGSIQIRHLLDVIINDFGLDFIKSKVTNPLYGLRVAPYLGCMVPRPDYQHRWSDYEQPTELDDLLKVLGAEIIDFPQKTNCCGGHMTQIGPETAYELIRRLISAAEENNAHIMVTVCPMCQMNLDAYQSETNRFFGTNFHMPIVFFTQLMALAFGKTPLEAGFGMELTNAEDALTHINKNAPVTTANGPEKPTGLPMPIRKHKIFASGKESME